MHYAANLSIMFTELDLTDRPAAARAAGFDAVEFWWPWPTATPEEADVDAFVRAILNAGVRLVGLNFFGGDMPAGDRGIASWPGREQEFLASALTAVRIAERTGCLAFNGLYGNRLPGVDPVEQDAVADDNIGFAAGVVGRIGGAVLIEPVSGVPAYPLRTADAVVAAIDRIVGETGVTNIGLLADFYHLSVNGDDVSKVISVHSEQIRHVQIADAPGRHEPGTGDLDLTGWLRQLAATGYTGYVAAEYQPAAGTLAGLGWLTRYGWLAEEEGTA